MVCSLKTASAGVSRKLLLTATMAWLLTGEASSAQEPGGALATGFRTPPPSSQPRVWWHWMDGNISKAGIDADMAWMKRVGVAGVQNFDAAFQGPQIVKERLIFLSPGWRDAFRRAVTEADRLGLEFAIAGSPGWSETGGPWVRPEQAMKKLVWSETAVMGGRPFRGVLAPPPAVTGPFQSLVGGGGAVAGSQKQVADFYRDAAVVAYRTPPADNPPLALRPVITASSPIDASRLTDGDLNATIDLPFGGATGESWVQFDYGKPQTIRALTLAAARAGGRGEFGRTGPEGVIQFSDDGRKFRPLARLPVTGAPQQTIAISETTARYFRVLFLPRRSTGAGPAPKSHAIAELAFLSGARVNRFEDKAGWSAEAGLEDQPTPPSAALTTIASKDVIDLTGRLRSDGSLHWTPPAGRWTVLRMGYSLTGRENHPAAPEGTGLEVDKLNRQAVKAYADAYLGEFEATVGRNLMGRRGVQFMITDSWEAGAQNWTDDMIAQFTKRRGYDPHPWLPVLTGRVVQSVSASEAFLWDFRRTIGELIADEHYGQLTASLHERGMGRYGESHESGRALVADGMLVKKSADVPMGATWATPTFSGASSASYAADIRETGSVAHIYGQNIAAAESFTATPVGGAYGFSPERLKPVADRMMANGVNRFVIHTSVHQPVEGPGPGLGLGPFGQWFTRKETWAEMAGPWLTYLARSSFLLQQGRYAADVAWFYGEDSNITALYGKGLPIVPEGYAFDFINADALLTLLSVKDGRLVTPSGMSYAVLALGPESRRMTLPVLRKIADLVAAGGVVVGAKPQMSPSLADDPAQFRALADQLWSGQGAGSGRILPALNLAAALSSAKAQPDVTYEPLPDGVQLAFVHRRLADGEVYFISLPSDRPRTVDVGFNVLGKSPQLWRADTGAITPLSYRTQGGRTVVTLDLAANDAVFVVLREPSAKSSRNLPPVVRSVVAPLEGPWDVSFPAHAGAPPEVRFSALASWTDNPDPGVKYFSGVATYSRVLTVPKAWLGQGSRVVLDLGAVANLAEVSVNGRSVGSAWKAPFEVDIT